MPYISITTNTPISSDKKGAVKKQLGQLISIIPGKSESVLMVGINDNYDMCYQGENIPCAYVHTVCFGPAARDAKSAFVAKMAQMLEETAGIPADNIYTTFSEKDCWGVGPALM